VAAGQTWDVLQADGPDMKHYAHYGTLMDLTDSFTEEEMMQWFPQSVEEGSYKGRFFGPPMMQSCALLMYNKDLTEAAGVTPPEKLEDSWTMEEALEVWKKTTVDSNGDGAPETWGLQVAGANWPGDYQTNVFKRSAGEEGSPTYQGISEDGLTFTGYFDTPEAIEGMKFYQGLFQESQVTPLEMVMPLFENKLSAFMLTPDNRVGIVQDMHGDDFRWGVTGHPYFETMMCQTGSWHYGISPKTEHFEEALAFVKFVSSDAGALIQYSINRQLPANVNIFSELPEYNEGGAQYMWLQAMQSIGRPRVQTPCYTEYNQLFGEMGLNIQKGADVESEMKSAAQLMDGVCSKYAE
jgi:ABC-type glycerol-3-phosphate transport system substrate-binding protein